MQNIGSSFGSMSSIRKPKQIYHIFKGKWGDGPIFDWYRSLTNQAPARAIQKLQIWKDVSGPVPHRFVVLHMSDGLTHRFDRRPARGGNTNRMLANHPVPSEDACEINVNLALATRASVCEIELALGGKVDIVTVLSTCQAISSDPVAHEYSLLRYNCFFFSWTILMVVSRRYLPHSPPAPESVKPRLCFELNRITEFIVDECVTLCLDIVTKITAILRDKANSSGILPDYHPVIRVVWALPTSVLQFIVRKSFKLCLHCGLRTEFTKKIKAEIEKAGDYVQEASLSAQSALEALDNYLWIEDTKETIRNALETEVMKGVWIAILETVSAGFGNIRPEDLVAELNSSNTQFSILGPTISQLFAVFNAALHGGLQGAKDVGQSIKGLSHGQAFDAVWRATCDGSLNAAKTVVDNTSQMINNPRHDANWAFVWTIWKDVWEIAHPAVRPRAVQTVERFVERIISAGVTAVMDDMKQSTANTIHARMPDKKRRKWLLGASRKSGGNYTNSQLQEHMHKTIEKDTINAETLKELHSTMARLWNHHPNFDLPTDVLDTIVEEIADSTC
ncbi:hypothetical protein FRC07_003637 [Ceratobasidium sp. 392]|nr:hypothetical protein FRC07_003637 [Ceratobasidium sp. 392]